MRLCPRCWGLIRRILERRLHWRSQRRRIDARFLIDTRTIGVVRRQYRIIRRFGKWWLRVGWMWCVDGRHVSKNLHERSDEYHSRAVIAVSKTRADRSLRSAADSHRLVLWYATWPGACSSIRWSDRGGAVWTSDARGRHESHVRRHNFGNRCRGSDARSVRVRRSSGRTRKCDGRTNAAPGVTGQRGNRARWAGL